MKIVAINPLFQIRTWEVLFKGILVSNTCAISKKCAANDSGTDSGEIYLSLWSAKAISVNVHVEFSPYMFLSSSQVF